MLNAGEGLVEGDSQEQLRQLKQAFFALAMEREARVAASGWTNSDGAMGEDVLVFSGVQLERLRPTLRRDRFGREVAELVYAPGAEKDVSENAACVPQPLRPQRLNLKVAVDTSGSAQTANIAQSAALLLRNKIKAAYDENRLTRVSTLITGPVRSGTSAGTRQSAYHRYMTDGPRRTADMEIRLRIGPGKSVDTTARWALASGAVGHARSSGGRPDNCTRQCVTA